MSEIVILELPEPLARSARAVTARTSQRLEDVLVAWLDRAAADLPVSALPDEQRRMSEPSPPAVAETATADDARV